MQEETKKDYLKSVCKSLEESRSSFEDHWQDIADHTFPRSYRWLTDDWSSRGNKANKKIIDATATIALRTLVAFFSSGITPSSRPWKSFKTSDARLGGDHSVKTYLAECNELMDSYILQSNFYREASKLYQQCATFGTAAMLIEEDERDHFRCETQPAGSYFLGVDSRQRVNQFFRKIKMTARQMKQQFGYDALSKKVQETFDDKKKRDSVRIEVWHYIGPNDDYTGDTIDKEFKSCYMEVLNDEDKFLREAGYDEFPVVAPRWSAIGDDIYGQDCPAQTILGSIKELQHAWKQVHKAWEKQVNPPLNAPESSRRSTIETFAGAVNFHDSRSNNDGIRPTYQVQFDTQGVMLGINDLREQIKDAFFYNQFMMVASQRRSGTKAREIEELADEKMNSLATTYEQFSNEFLDPAVTRMFNICNRRGALPEAPAQFQGMPFTIEYVSVMAQAMKMVGIGNMDRALAILGQVATIAPEVMDIMNSDVFTTQYWERLGVDPRAMSSPEQIQNKRAARAQAQQAQQQQQDMAVQADTAKVLSETKNDPDSALAALVQQTQAFQ